MLDELDRVEDDEALSLLADTVKTLSDHGTGVTLMFVGVAASVEHLLGEHESIVRNVRQIPMQRMSRDELETLLEKGFGQVNGLAVTDQAINRIINAAEGLPHFAHLLGLSAGRAAVSDDRSVVEQRDVDRAEADAIRTHSMFSEYRRATDIPQPGQPFRAGPPRVRLRTPRRSWIFSGRGRQRAAVRHRGTPHDLPAVSAPPI